MPCYGVKKKQVGLNLGRLGTSKSQWQKIPDGEISGIFCHRVKEGPIDPWIWKPFFQMMLCNQMLCNNDKKESKTNVKVIRKPRGPVTKNSRVKNAGIFCHSVKTGCIQCWIEKIGWIWSRLIKCHAIVSKKQVRLNS